MIYLVCMYNEQVFEQGADEGFGYLLRTNSEQEAKNFFWDQIAEWEIL